MYLTPQGDLAFARGLDGVKQDCEHAMQAQLGEMVLNLTQGIPTMETIWSRWNPIQFEAYARRALLLVPNVRAVTAFQVDRIDGVAVYSATIQVNADTIDISGAIANV